MGRKEEATERGGWASGDGVGVGAGGLKPLWPQPLHFSRFRFVNSSVLEECALSVYNLCPVRLGPEGPCRCLKPEVRGSQAAFGLSRWILVGPALGSQTCGH